MRRAAFMFALLGLLLATGACGKEEGDSAAAGVKWPEAPEDGAPLALEFLAMEGSGDKRGARMRAFNFSDRPITGFSATLHYLDQEGKELDDFPWSHQAAATLAEPKGHAEIEVGAFVPEETAKVSAEITRVSFRGGSAWKTE